MTRPAGPRPEGPLTCFERKLIARFLSGRLVGIENAITSLRKGLKLDTTGYCRQNLLYWLHVRGWVRQALRQLDLKHHKVSDNA